MWVQFFCMKSVVWAVSSCHMILKVKVKVCSFPNFQGENDKQFVMYVHKPSSCVLHYALS
jgi:hypothetical protein